MRRIVAILILLIVALPAAAQIGKQPMIRAGTPEDKAMTEIDDAADSATKLTLLAKFVADFGQTDMILLAYERYVAIYSADKNYAKAFEYGEKALQYDRGNLNAAIGLVRTAQEAGDTQKMFDYGDRAGTILQQYKVSAAPAGTDADAWKELQRVALERSAEQIGYLHSAPLNAASQVADPAAKVSLLERYIKAFPDSPYLSNAQVLAAAVMTMQASTWSENGTQLDQAQAYAARSLELLAQAAKPEQLTQEQWAQQKALQQGLAQTAQGRIHVHKGRNAQAVDVLRAAAPLLKSDPASYAGNQYWLGFALLNLKRNPEARTAFSEAAAINSPYQGEAKKKLAELGPGGRAPAKKRP